MTFLGWMALAGFLLLFMALSSALIKRLPITTSAIYLCLGVIIGPVGLGLIEVNSISSSELFEHVTELALILSLFIGGLHLRLPLRDAAWAAAYRLAGPVMLICIAGVAVTAHFAFGIEWPVAFLLGAVLAPTDPVLASQVSVNDASDHDRMRYGLSGEAGFNDGAAFPFVIFGLLWLEYGRIGDWTAGWLLHRIVWAIPAGLLVGYLVGKAVGRLAIWLRSRYLDRDSPNDFLALALIAIVYAGAEWIGAWGFLAAFAAGIGFRRAEIRVVADNPHPDAEQSVDGEVTDGGVAHPPAESMLGGSRSEEDELYHPANSAGEVLSEIISFGGSMERLMEVLLIVLVGVCIGVYWDWRALPLALVLFLIIRPLAVLGSMVRTATSKQQRVLMGWFGIKGIGSLYYLSYAINHGAATHASDLTSLTFSVVALSVVIHGFSTQPILNWYERSLGR